MSSLALSTCMYTKSLAIVIAGDGNGEDDEEELESKSE